jgi:hypothetical protein
MNTPYDLNINDLDNNSSMLYKRAIQLNVPLRYMLIKQLDRRIADDSDLINKKKKDNYEYTTIFNFISDNIDDINKMYDKVKGFKGPQLYVLDFLFSVIRVKGLDYASISEIQKLLSNNQEQRSFRDIKSVEDYYNQWKLSYEQELNKDISITKDLITQQNTLSNLIPLSCSELEVEAITFMYDLPVGYNPLPDIFDFFVANYEVPFMQYIDDSGHKRFRIYKGANEDLPVNLINVNLPQSSALKNDVIYVKLWSGQHEPTDKTYLDNIQRIISSPKEAFQIATLSYISTSKIMRFRITSPYRGIDKATLISRLHRSIKLPLPLPDPNTITDNKLKGSFYIYDIDVNNDLLHYLVLNVPTFRQYLYIEEGSTKSLPAKTRMNINYKPSYLDASILSRGKKNISVKTPLKAICFREIIASGNVITLKDGSSKTLTQDMICLKLKIERASNLDLAEQFMNICSRLFYLYQEHQTAGLSLYFDYIPQYQKVIEYNLKNKTIMEKKVRQLDIHARAGGASNLLLDLQAKAPEIFVTKYARECMKNMQPVILEESEVDDFEAQTFIDKEGNTKNYKTMKFDKYILGCPHPHAPYVGLKINKKLSNKEEFPYIPCCYIEDQTQKNTAYRKSLNNENTEISNAYVSSSAKAQAEGRIAQLPYLLVNMLSEYDNGLYHRRGTLLGPNSFISAVAYAMGDDRDVYAIRADLLNKVNPAVCGQQMWDYSIDDIIGLVNDNDMYLDPLKTYRILEEYYNINIYMFGVREFDPHTAEYNNLFVYPRYKLTHIRNKLPYPNAVLIAMVETDWGYQCEVIVKDNIALFDSKMTDLLYDCYNYCCRTLTLTVSDYGLNMREKLFNIIDYSFLITPDIKLISQVLDQYGKCRMICIEYNNQKFLLHCPPSQPFNIGLYQPEEYKYPTIDQVIELMGTPDYAYKDYEQKGYICGLSYNCGDINNAFNIPIQPIYNETKIPIYYNAVLPRYENSNYGSNILAKIHNLSKCAKFIKTIFVILMSENNLTPEQTLLKYAYVLDIGTVQDANWAPIPAEILHSSDEVDVNLIKRSYRFKSFPRVYARESIISLLKIRCPYLIKDDRIILEDIRTYAGVRYWLKYYAKNTSDQMKLLLKNEKYFIIDNYYSERRDFITRPNEFLLLNENEYKLWSSRYIFSNIIHNRSVQHVQNMIQTTLKVNDHQIKDPFVFYIPHDNLTGPGSHPEHDKYYIIQSVAEGDLYRALNVCYNWYIYNRNIGFYAEPIPRSQPPSYKIYNINSGGGISLKLDKSVGESYLMVLEYNQDNYGCLLPLN